ncbi:4-diphosphocytidyl-2-C-methyl-D-erythritol kinase [Haloechinothrix alba]|uniref:4-diphosphocytidyl-2-C-methyl-D-erythritol kinase n=1 Tax=Haloechinothrix alba TaxID=664784 RepID=A0A238VET4_9PSEU|nr:4-(cytidine 5'-diphospho)-2-C-methyl-D-erythritol kinase [Haloechinothrix alba]SNR32766.1 4-diphosphocytidyl-2-C-methyl-D-erythritol kinase [Haloechinothrix alba]
MLAVVPPPVTVRAPSKINLHLGIGDQRSDGYHEISTVFQALSLSDDVTVAASEEPGVDVQGEGTGTIPRNSDNLAWRAVRLLADHVGRPEDEAGVRVMIRKEIPVAGGMAGGSADAAAVLVGLSALWDLDVTREDLGTLAVQLGSDVPFALSGGTALGTGRGEQLVPVLSRHTFHWVLAFDNRGLSTPKVYGELDRLRAVGDPPRVGSYDPLVEALASGDPRQLALLLGNDLQAAAVSLRSNLRRTLRAGVEAGALAGVVSGSGPTCAFLCTDGDSAVEVAAQLAGAGVCRTVRVAHGPVHGARIVDGEDSPEPTPPPQVHA